MIQKIQAIRGMNDILPDQVLAWQFIEEKFANLLNQYGYEEIRFPIVENTLLFKRSIGEITDVVEKEMYTFNDLNSDSLSLRPEGTAGCLRACIENNLLRNNQQKLWYYGPMFRHERPQKGRYRQFHQFGVEALGIDGIYIEVELITLCKNLWQRLGIDKHLKLQLNTLGELSERQAYIAKLKDYLKSHYDVLDEDSKRRLEKNPLRILDSKNQATQELLKQAPRLEDSLSAASKDKFQALCTSLDSMGIDFEINPFLVRGLDYYDHTVFEWVTDKLGSQATVCAGGRYDALIAQLGGDKAPAIGFAIGIERLLLLRETLELDTEAKTHPTIFIIASNDVCVQEALVLADKIRALPNSWRVLTNLAGGSFKSQFKKADKSGADLALIIGENELKSQQISIKNLRKLTEQVTIHRDEITIYLQDHLGEN